MTDAEQSSPKGLDETHGLLLVSDLIAELRSQAEDMRCQQNLGSYADRTEDAADTLEKYVKAMDAICNHNAAATDLELQQRGEIAQLERELTEAREIIAAALRALPVGYLPAHTPESIPARIEDLCRTIVETERERDEWIKKVAQYSGTNVGLNLDLHLAKEDLADLREQVRLTIMENLHLADGDNCTLKRLKDAIDFSLDSPENA